MSPTPKCATRGCEYDATRSIAGVKARFCTICYLERTAVDVRRARRTLKADAHTKEMFNV